MVVAVDGIALLGLWLVSLFLLVVEFIEYKWFMEILFIALNGLIVIYTILFFCKIAFIVFFIYFFIVSLLIIFLTFFIVCIICN
jgi:hypothetical protein